MPPHHVPKELKKLANDLKRANPDWELSHCYAVATNKARIWCATSKNPVVKAKWCEVASQLKPGKEAL